MTFRVLQIIAISALSYEFSKHLVPFNAIHLLFWIGIVAFSIWKIIINPKKWGLRLGIAFAMIAVVQFSLLSLYMSETGSGLDRSWSTIIISFSPLFLISACFCAMSFVSGGDRMEPA